MPMPIHPLTTTEEYCSKRSSWTFIPLYKQWRWKELFYW
jgi:hypothetical protein